MNNLVWQESDFQWLDDEKSLDKRLPREEFEIKNADIALSVKAIILDEFGRLLLLRNNPEFAQFEFDLPGGHMDQAKDSSLAEALVRELKEETNLDLIEAKQFNTETEVRIGEDNHPCLFFKVTVSGPIKTSEEHLGYSWIFPDDLDMLDLGAFKEPLKEFFGIEKDVEKYDTFTAHPIADIIASGKEKEIEKSHDGGIIALVPFEEISKQLEVPNGIPWNEMHITLAYIKNPWNSDPTKIVKDLDIPKFEGRINGYERFAGQEGKDTLVARIVVPGLDNWRTQLTGKLIDAGFSLSDFYTFKSHITLANLNKGQEYGVDYKPEVSEEFSKIPIIFKSIEVWNGDDKKIIVVLNKHDEGVLQKLQPPRPGLVPQTGDYEHPFRWIKEKNTQIFTHDKDFSGRSNLALIKKRGLVIEEKRQGVATKELDKRLGRPLAIYTFSFDDWINRMKDRSAHGDVIARWRIANQIFVILTPALQRATEVQDYILAHTDSNLLDTQERWRKARRAFGKDISHIGKAEYATKINIPVSNLIFGDEISKGSEDIWMDVDELKKEINKIAKERQISNILKSDLIIHVWIPNEGDAESEKDFTPVEKSESPDAYTTEIYSFIDETLEKAGMKIPGKIQRNAKQTGREIEYELYRSLSEEVKEFLDNLDGSEPPEKVLEGVREALKRWQLRALPMADAAFTRLFTQGFQAGALLAGIPMKMGENDINALKVLQQGKYRIGERIVLFGDEETKEFQKVIWNAYEPDGFFNLKDMSDAVLDKVQADRFRINTIIRTETSNISMLGRLNAWSKDPEAHFFSYIWSHANDSRTREMKRIRAAWSPLTLEEAIYLWTHNEQRLSNGKFQNGNINCRCTISRYPRDDEYTGNRFAGQEGNFHETIDFNLG